MLQILMGAMSATSFGVADFMASHSSRRLGARSALTGMLLVSTAVISLFVVFSPATDGLAVGRPWIACLHGVAMAAALLLFFRAMELGPVSVAAPIVASHPLFIMGFALATGSRPSAVQLAAMLLIVAGLMVVAAGNRKPAIVLHAGAFRSPRGALALALAASVIYAIAIVSAQQAVRWSDDLAVLWLGRVSGLAFLLVCAGLARSVPRLPPRWWPFLAAHGLLDSAGLLFLLMGSTGQLDEVTAVVASTFTMVTVLLARLFYGEQVSPRQLSGILAIFGGVALLSAGL